MGLDKDGSIAGEDRALRGRLHHLLQRYVTVAACTAAFLGFMFQSTPAVAFLDFLFGRPSAAPAAPVPAYSSSPLGVSVKPRMGSRTHSFRHKGEVGRRPARPERDSARAERSSSKITADRQISIDPVKHPDWHLKDPNIRYGDILILASGPVVFQGSKASRSQEDFVSLNQSHLTSGDSLRDVRMMVSGVWTPQAADAEPPKKANRWARHQ